MPDLLIKGWQWICLAVGGGFFAIGTLGLFRFSDTFSRVHALTKVDNLGLGFIVIGLLPAVESVAGGVKLMLVWGAALAASATSAHLVARTVQRRPGMTLNEEYQRDD